MICHRARLKFADVMNVNVTMYKITPTKVSSIKYLGVKVGNKLNWIDHIVFLNKKIFKGIWIMYKARRYLDWNNFKISTMLIS